MSEPTVLRLPALEVSQGREQRLYSFAVDGKLIPGFATVSRVRRDEEHELNGYQRPEVLAHIRNIRRYIESATPLLPNALVVAFDRRVRFEPASLRATVDFVRHGTLVVPCGADVRDKPGWIVDGQQRSAAIRDARVEKFPVLVTAFITDSQSEQREQFLLVNAARPLPRGLIHELLPATNGTLPVFLERRRFPAYLVSRLNGDPDSPFHRLIRTPTSSEGVVRDNSVLRMIENSLSDGALYPYRDPVSGRGDAEAALDLLKTYWGAVAGVFEEAWGLPPRRSRLMHGVGVVALGFLMDAIVDRCRVAHLAPDLDAFADDLDRLRPVCRWTDGWWEVRGESSTRQWNELQNTPRDIQWLTNLLLREYRRCLADEP